MRARDWTLLVIAAAGGRSVSPVQLQKALFLLKQNLGTKLAREDFYEFEPYDYGPFNGTIYHDAEVLASEGLVSIDIPVSQRYREYSATAEGLARANTLRAAIDVQVREYLDRVVRWVRSLGFNALVQAIYDKYPWTAKNSVFRRLTKATP
jgi:uncharacterized phage-associated protein